MSAEIALGVFVFWCICAVAGGYIAGERGRPHVEGVAFGFLFGPIGLIVESLMPAKGVAAVVATVAEMKPSPQNRRIKADRDDVAMDFVMDLVRQSEAKAGSRSLHK